MAEKKLWEFLDGSGLTRYHLKIKQLIEDSKYDDTAIKSDIKSNTDAIALLNGESTQEGSVRSTVAEEIAKIIGGATESFDTLKEVEDWISDHAEGAAAMNTQILENKNNISLLENKVTSLEESNTSQASEIEDIKKTYAKQADVDLLEKVYATKTEVSNLDNKFSTKEEVSALDEKFATKKEVTDLDDKFATKDEVTALDDKFATKTEVVELEKKTATKEEVEAGYVAKTTLTTLATKEELETVEGKINKLVDSSDKTVYTLGIEKGLIFVDDGKE